MTTATLQEQARALGDPTRHAIFRHVAEAGEPVGVAELNETFPLNHNAIRQHLAKLAAAGLVVQTSARGGGPGRPRLVYEVHPGVGGQWGTSGPYERLSELLVEIIATGRGPSEVGRRAADRFRVPAPTGDAVADIAAAMLRSGFEPEVRERRGGAEIVLNRCPFATAAVADRSTICALHLGIAEGLAAGAPSAVAELVAYDPRDAGCRLRISATGDTTDDERPAPTLTIRGRARSRRSRSSSSRRPAP